MVGPILNLDAGCSSPGNQSHRRVERLRQTSEGFDEKSCDTANHSENPWTYDPNHNRNLWNNNDEIKDGETTLVVDATDSRRKSKKKKQKQNRGTRSVKNSNLLNMELGNLNAQLKGSEDAKREFNTDDSVVEPVKRGKDALSVSALLSNHPEGSKLMINSWSLQARTTFQHVVVEEEDEERVSISGTFKFGDTSVNVIGTYGLYYEGKILASSNDRTVLVVEPAETENDKLHTFSNYVEGSNQDRVWNAATSAYAKLNWGKRWSKKDQFQTIKSRYLNFYPDHPALDREILNVMEDEKFEKLVSNSLRTWEKQWETITRNRLRTEMVPLGLDLEEEIKAIRGGTPWYKPWRWRLGWIAMFKVWFVTAMTSLIMILMNFSGPMLALGVLIAYYRTRCNLRNKGLTDKQALQQLASEHLSSNFGLTPCCSAYLRKQNYKHSGIKELPILDDFSIQTSYDPVDEDSEEKVEIYGTTIDGPMCYPASTEQNLDAGMRIRMGFERKIDNKTLLQFVSWAKSEIDKMPLFEVDCTTEEKANEHLVHQYGSKTAERIMRKYHKKLKPKHNKYTAFVKKEVYLKSKFKPRVIWTCPDIVISKFSYFFSQLSKMLKDHWNSSKEVMYASGVSPRELGAYAEEMEAYPYLWESDVSNWDGSLHHELLLLEKYFLQTKTTGWPDDLENYFDCWGEQHASSSKGGVKVNTRHCRRSGDLWTSIFNSLLNVLISKWAYCLNESEDYKIMVLGDDNAVASKHSINVDEVVAKYSKLGMTVEIVQRDSAESMSFCSGLFWKVDGGLKWGNLPFRTLAKLGMNHNNLSPKLFKRLLYGTAKSLLPTCGHVPVVQAIMRAIIATAEKAEIVPLYMDKDLKYKINGGFVSFPDNDTYAQFCRRYSIDFYTVHMLEEYILDNFSIDDCPYMLDDEVFKMGFEVDTGLDWEKNLKTEIEWGSVYDDVVVTGPIEEERLKLNNVSNIVEAINSGYSFGMDENNNFGTIGHQWLHALFSALSYINFGWGVRLHQIYNALAITSGRLPARNKKGKKKGNNNNQSKQNLKNMLKNAVGQGIRMAGGGLGGFLGGAPGAMLGKKIGGLVSQAIGMGDYEIVSNSLIGKKAHMAVPTFRDSGATLRLSFRELLGDVSGSTDFVATTYNINPGLSSCFPFASGIAKNYTEYKLEGLIFTFNSTCAEWNGVNAALGTVIMATRMNPTDPNFTSKRDMAQSYYSCTTKPSVSMNHGVECDEKVLGEDRHYVRVGTTAEDLKFYDWGKFTIATVGMNDNSVVGELWVTYDVVFRFPKIGLGGPEGTSYVSNRVVTTANLFGAVQLAPTGTLPMTIVNYSGGFNAIKLGPEISSGVFLVSVHWGGDVSGAITIPTVTYYNCSSAPPNNWYGSASTQAASFNNIMSNTHAFWKGWITIDGYDAAGSEIRFTPGTLPIGGATISVNIVVTRVS